MRSVRRMPMVAVISLVGSLTACSGTVGGGETSTGSAEAVEFSPASSGELHLYTWSDYFPVDLAAKF
ncbi:MAG: hypothetical protein LBO20_07120, partial [Bifidobacteriaceae bacterium]|nr:hypothetical protein [Bifidobacteriaceae bacterium]